MFVGLCRFDCYHITIDDVIHAPSRVPHALPNCLKEELFEMEQDGIMAKVDKPADWVNNLVIVEKKDGSLCLCLNPEDLTI